jgi:hypothetical protein
MCSGDAHAANCDRKPHDRWHSSRVSYDRQLPRASDASSSPVTVCPRDGDLTVNNRTSTINEQSATACFPALNAAPDLRPVAKKEADEDFRIR